MFFAKSKRSAFTLIEVCAAIAILLVGVVGIASLIPAALNASVKAKNISTAATLAEKWLEEKKKEVFISNTNWDNIQLTSETSFPSPNNNFKWSITSMDESAIPGLKQLTLRISWPEGSTTRNEDFDVFIAKR